MSAAAKTKVVPIMVLYRPRYWIFKEEIRSIFRNYSALSNGVNNKLLKNKGFADLAVPDNAPDKSLNQRRLWVILLQAFRFKVL